MTSGIEQFFAHPVTIARFAGDGTYGPVYDDPETVLGWVRDGTKLIADGTGGQIASSAQVALPASTAYVPVQSEVTLPDQFAAPGQTRVTRVISASRGDGGGLPTPDHIVLVLL